MGPDANPRMSQNNLTARYRPQTFAQVAGQESVKRILSRAAAQGKAAPAYLFSGTRGVGKTTIARIFAKALNCQNGPAAEPCNQCSVCRQITLGAAVDVVEIDGASNTGVDNVRRLKEDVGYAPLECRYKVIIIDEAHMLSKAAFNALLKTLEEPPGHVTFIMATTEPEKFPQTIISRCQHYVFKRLPLAGLVTHLTNVLAAEGIEAEASAISLIARRGAGSVRDSMSLLSQVLALGSAAVTLTDVREVLGLAGQEVFVRLVECVHGRDLVGLHGLLEEILDQGLDLGFFLRELAGCWRNLFLLNQLGEAGRQVVDLPDQELAIWCEWAHKFSLAHVHAAWQMTLDNQRKVLTSMEPGLALELLLVNLACLPELLAVGARETRGQDTARPAAPQRPIVPARPAQAPSARPQQMPAAQVAPVRPEPAPSRPASLQPAAQPQPAAVAREEQARFATTAPPARPQQVHAAGPAGPKTWSGFIKFCAKNQDPTRPVPRLQDTNGSVDGSELRISCSSSMLCSRLIEKQTLLAELASQYFGLPLSIRVEAPAEQVRKTRTELREMAASDPMIQTLQNQFKARIVEVRPTAENTAKES